ncbi:MAG: nucleotidyltransferase domain-containing protein [Candidatus Eisenbacteria bacterium]|nr:nucleotidyltransferase domain-containing protein [Candidatus Eisenbacteria bacterium]
MKLNEEQTARLRQLAEREGISLLLLFGSAVTEKIHADSDVDVAVLFQGERNLTGAEYSELVHELQELFPDHPVDLGVINHADPLFLGKITENCQILYGMPQTLQKLKIYAFKRYQDHRRYFDLEQKYVEKFLKTRKAAS